MEKEKLSKIINDLKEVRAETRTDVRDDVIFDTAVRVYNSEQIENHRQGNKSFFTGKNISTSTKTSFPDFPATQNQIWVLKNKLNYLGDTSKLKKKEASDMIDKIKKEIK